MHAVCMAVRVTAKNAFFLQICTICGLRKMCAEKLPTMLVQRSIRDRPRVRVCTCLGYNGHVIHLHQPIHRRSHAGYCSGNRSGYHISRLV
jgi:hypothetical protein